jgi:hypothetical protein
MIRKKMSLFFCVALLNSSGAFAAYIEGTDTTDVNGYNRDSTFRVTSTTTNAVTGQNIVRYRCDEASTGYFNHAFNDIKMAPDSNKSAPYVTGNTYCFVIKKTKDNTYSKIQILSRLPDNRYVYRYGTNTVPNDPLLINAAYDRSVRYKPNNFSNFFQYHCTLYDFCQRNTSSWEAPLPNNNTLLGYIYYRAKNGVTIDTTAPINMAQWDSIAFTTSTSYVFSGQPFQYFNLVAVYAQGRSEFLLGWSKRTAAVVDVKQGSPAAVLVPNTLTVQKTGKGFVFSLLKPGKNSDVASLTIFNANGTTMARFSEIKSNRIVWNIADRDSPDGLFIVKVELLDRSTITRTVIVTK